MSKILVLGAGQIGTAIAAMLAGSGDYDVTLGDSDSDALKRDLPEDVKPLVVDTEDARALEAALKGCDAVVSACPYFLNVAIAEAAAQDGVHFFDLTEDVAVSRRVRELAAGSDIAFVPQCGLAPGFISIVANAFVNRFDEPYDVRLRVGALPQFPDNALRYNLTWSTEGLINEYCNPCEAIVDGQRREVTPLEGLEYFTIEGVRYETFSTSGGVGTLCETFEGRVRNLNYKTVRYPGHRDLVHMLVSDLRLCERRDIFRDIIEHGIPTTRQDVVLIFVTVTGLIEGRLTQESYVKKIYGNSAPGGLNGIQTTTASAACAMVDLHREGKLPAKGFVRQEQASYSDFIANRFGQVYA
ncbi:MAG: saccharopine dehydrogenase NADP-binding domain-containing protein [Alphaproteobacteria bacterium]